MKYINKFITLLSISFTLIACSESHKPLISNEIAKEFVDHFNAFHNDYYKKNNIKSVTATFIKTPSIQNRYHYNEFGDLQKIEVVNLNNLDDVNIKEYDLIYENNKLVKRRYENSLLTESIFEYQENQIIKISDFRENELIYSTEFNHSQNNFLNNSIFNCFSSIGTQGACAPVTTSEYEYQNGNLIQINKIKTNGQKERVALLKYDNTSNLPSSVIQFNTEELKLTYQYSN